MPPPCMAWVAITPSAAATVRPPALFYRAGSLHCALHHPAAGCEGIKALRIELNLLALLHVGGCGARLVRPLAVFRHPGEWLEDAQQRAKVWFQVRGCRSRAAAAWVSTPLSCS